MTTAISIIFTAEAEVTHADGTKDTDPPETEAQDDEHN